MNFDLLLQRPPHEVKKIASLRGELTATSGERSRPSAFPNWAKRNRSSSGLRASRSLWSRVRKHKTDSQIFPLPLGEGRGVRAAEVLIVDLPSLSRVIMPKKSRGKSACGCDSTTPATRWPRTAPGFSTTRPIWKAPAANESIMARSKRRPKNNEVGVAYFFTMTGRWTHSPSSTKRPARLSTRISSTSSRISRCHKGKMLNAEC